jgi:hypothetical protein
MPMVTFRVMVVIKHSRCAFSRPDERQTIADTFRILAADWHPPNDGFVEVTPFIGVLLME